MRSGGGHSHVLGYRVFPPRFPQVLGYLEYSWAGAVSLGSAPPDWRSSHRITLTFLVRTNSRYWVYDVDKPSCPSCQQHPDLGRAAPAPKGSGCGVSPPRPPAAAAAASLGFCPDLPPGPLYCLPCWHLPTVFQLPRMVYNLKPTPGRHSDSVLFSQEGHLLPFPVSIFSCLPIGWLSLQHFSASWSVTSRFFRRPFLSS